MLRLMREYATNWLIKLILGAIVIVFVFWGVGSFREERKARIATVNDQPISYEQYRTAHNNLVEQYRRQFGGKMDQKTIEMLGLERMALNNLIDQEVLLQQARNMDFRVSDQELIESIHKIDAFKSAGIFDPQLYSRILNQYRMTPEGFEAMQKEAMLIEKYRRFITSNVMVSDLEALEWFKWDNAQIKIDYVLFEPEKETDIVVTDEDLKKYHESKKESYKTEPKIKAQYIHFNPEQYKEKVKVTDEEIKDYYNSNTDAFKTEKTVKARHILFKLDPDSSPEIVNEKMKKALEVMEKAKSGEDFAELAMMYSEGPTKDKGGDLGTFERGKMVKPFSDKAFSMNPGEISEPVRTEFGFHIIKVEAVNEASRQSLEEARQEIVDKLSAEKAEAIAYDEAEAVYESTYEGDDLAGVAENQGLTISRTDFFTKKGPEKGVKEPRQFAEVAFALPKKSISEVQELGDGYYLIQVIEKVPEQVAEYETVKDKVEADYKKDKKDEAAKNKATEFLDILKNGGDLAEEAKKLEYTLSTTEFFKRTGSIPGIGYEPKIGQAAFKLDEKQKLSQELIKGRKGYYIISFKESKTADQDEFEKQKAAIKQRLLSQKQYKAFQSRLTQAKEASNIWIKEDFLK